MVDVNLSHYITVWFIHVDLFQLHPFLKMFFVDSLFFNKTTQNIKIMKLRQNKFQLHAIFVKVVHVVPFHEVKRLNCSYSSSVQVKLKL